MSPVELTFGIFLVGVLLVLASFFAGRQMRTRRLLRLEAPLSPEDRTYLLGQVRRRLICSALMVLFALFLVGWFFMEGDFRNLTPAEGAAAEEIEANKNALRFYTGYWIFGLLILLAIMVLATLDLIATARFGARKSRQLISDHRAMLENEAAKLRQRHELN